MGNSKKCLAIFEAVPHCYQSGGGITAYAATLALKQAGFDVRVISLSSVPLSGGKSEGEHVSHLEEMGIEMRVLPQNLLSRMVPKFWGRWLPLTIGAVYPEFFLRSHIEREIREYGPNIIIGYSWNAVAATHGIRGVPKFGMVGDPTHLPILFRRAFERRFAGIAVKKKLKTVIREWLELVLSKWAMRSVLNDCRESGAFAAHHAQELVDLGVRNCKYLRTPTPDPFSGNFLDSASLKPEKLTVLHVGHLRGTATLSGVELLASEVLPALSERVGLGNFETRIVGSNPESLPMDLRNRLSSPSVSIVGHVPNIGDEFAKAHVVVVPTPIELGIRVRILTALSYGACVVAHSANKKGIPELVHGKNCLLADSGAEIAAHIFSVYSNPSVARALRAGARATYESHFSIEVAGQNIAEIAQGMLTPFDCERESKVATVSI